MTELQKLVESVMKEKLWELSWNLGWCYFKLKHWAKAQKYLTKAMKLAPANHACKYALGQVYLKKKQYKKAELILAEALHIKESHATRIGLALAYLGQGKIKQAEKTHLDGIKLKPKKSEGYESYATFLSDV